jgi:hypothetical protein
LILVIDNGAYAIEQYLIDPRVFEDPSRPELPYVQLNRWDYTETAASLGATFVRAVDKQPALADALRAALEHNGTGLISVRVSPRELPPENRRPGAGNSSSKHTAISEMPQERVIAEFPGMTVHAGGEAGRREAVETRSAHALIVPRSSGLRAVLQKGRSFQRSNPHIPVLVDRGRYLIVDLPASARVHEEPGCFALAREEDYPVGFQVRRATPGVRRDDISAVLERLSGSMLQTVVNELAAIFTRYSLSEGYGQAVKLSERWLREAGCTVQRDAVSIPGGATANVIGSRTGTAENRRLFIVCAHLDSVNHEDGAGGRAPGADDNATGSATVVAIASAIAGVQLRHDARFILFGGEEQGLLGSKAYVDRLSTADRGRIRGVVNIDMAGSKNMPDLSVLLEGADISRMVVEDLARVASTYTALTTQISFQPYASDHVPFIDARIPAVLTIEGADGAYAHEHTARDTTDKVNNDLHREITAMNLAWLLEQTM